MKRLTVHYGVRFGGRKKTHTVDEIYDSDKFSCLAPSVNSFLTYQFFFSSHDIQIIY